MKKKFFSKNIKSYKKNYSRRHRIFNSILLKKKIDILNNEFDNKDKNKLDDLKILIKKCRNIGTLNFSILARHGFIAKSFINSLIKKNIYRKRNRFI